MNGIGAALTARLTTEPGDLKYTTAGRPYLSFSVVVSVSGSGSGDAEPTWVKVTVWESLAEQMAAVLSKGTDVYVEGRLRLNHWKSGDGTERSGLSVSAWRCDALGQIGKRAPQRATKLRPRTAWAAEDESASVRTS